MNRFSKVLWHFWNAKGLYVDVLEHGDMQKSCFQTRFDVYETLCPQQMLVHKGDQIKNWSGECKDIIPTKLQCQTIQRTLQSPNLPKKIKYFFFKFSPIDLLIILYQLTKFEAPSCYSF